MRTLLEFIKDDWRAAGNTGPLTAEFIAAWRLANPLYGRATLNTQFGNGSSIPCGGKTRLDRATTAWLASGRPRPSAPDFPREEFDEFVREFLDEFSDEWYAPKVKSKGKAKK